MFIFLFPFNSKGGFPPNRQKKKQTKTVFLNKKQQMCSKNWTVLKTCLFGNSVLVNKTLSHLESVDQRKTSLFLFFCPVGWYTSFCSKNIRAQLIQVAINKRDLIRPHRAPVLFEILKKLKLWINILMIENCPEWLLSTSEFMSGDPTPKFPLPCNLYFSWRF